jgi:broad specificity phosphatase PhoE
MNESAPTIESQEALKAKIELHFFRHDEKESDKTKSDTEVRLTEEGRLHAASLSNPDTNLNQSVAFGSPRKRTQETAGLVMSGHQDPITGTENLEELKSKLNADLGYGSKVNVDSRLDFFLNESGPYLEEGLKAFKEGYFLKWLVEESDQKFKEQNIKEGYFSYSNQARQIAQIIEKYLKVLPRWKELVNDRTKSYEPELERFLGTHQTVSECFLAKVIELTQGVEERDKFVKALDNVGFDYAEGFEVDVEESDSGEPTLRIRFKKESEDPEKAFIFDQTISADMLKQIL